MATSVQSWQQVLDDTDEETARLILRLQLEDLETGPEIHATAPESANTQSSDFEIASSLYATELQLYKESRPFRTATPEPPPELQVEQTVQLFECVICGERFDADHCYQVPCQHYYCDACLSDLFRVAMSNEQAYPPRCCTQTVPFEDVSIFLERQVARDFAIKRQELDDPKRTYCHVPVCSAYIGEDCKEGDRAKCASCNAETCVLCTLTYHEGDCVHDEAIEETLELARQEGWQKCPQCGRMVELSTGCNHMACLCKAQFCYVCGVTWRNCSCPQFDERHLYERGQVIAEREGRGDVERVVRNLRENHNCENGHEWASVRGRHNCETCQNSLPHYIYRCARCRTQICGHCRYTRT